MEMELELDVIRATFAALLYGLGRCEQKFEKFLKNY